MCATISLYIAYGVIYMVCTFFGHKDCPSEIRDQLKQKLIYLIENCGVDEFYVGCNGAFDRLVRLVLMELKTLYPIRYSVVLAYMPQKKTDEDLSDTIYPEGLEKTPLRYAIGERNKWMIRCADYVVTYIRYTASNAANFAEFAKRRGKIIIAL